MPTDLLNRIDAAQKQAHETGTLQPILTEHLVVEAAGLPFLVSWVSSLREKDSARAHAAGLQRPHGSPFLPPEPELTVGEYRDTHLLVLNKYPVLARHLLIVTREFEAQTDPLTEEDFDALASVMQLYGGLGFYNGGSDAGASQRHKHLQWVPALSQTIGLSAFAPAVAHASITVNAALPWRHCFVSLNGEKQPQKALGARLHQAFRSACAELELDPDRQPMRPYNLLVNPQWLLVVPRSREHYQEISVNALGFAGSLFVRNPEQLETVRRLGPLKLLTHVGRR